MKDAAAAAAVQQPQQQQQQRAGLCRLLMVSLTRFYLTSNHMEQVLPFITGESSVSLRLIDWFVTNFTKKHNSVLTRVVDNDVVHFNIHLSYRAQLKAYSKQQFDPFRRREKIQFHYSVGACVVTTVGQLNFFRWMIENQVLQYVAAHAHIVEQDMLAREAEAAEAGTVAAAAAAAAATAAAPMDGCGSGSTTAASTSKNHSHSHSHAPGHVHAHALTRRRNSTTLVAFD
jgi:hypothetical protein